MLFSHNNVRIRVGGIVQSRGTILLVSHKKDGDVYWLIPGGGVNFGESLEEALIREFKEELNITIQADKLAMIFDSIDPSGERHILNIYFYCTYLEGAYTLGRERRLNGYDFFPADEIVNLPMYPPINSHLISIARGEEIDAYLGKLWSDK